MTTPPHFLGQEERSISADENILYCNLDRKKPTYIWRRVCRRALCIMFSFLYVCLHIYSHSGCECVWGQIHAHSRLPRIYIDLIMLNIIIILIILLCSQFEFVWTCTAAGSKTTVIHFEWLHLMKIMVSGHFKVMETTSLNRSHSSPENKIWYFFGQTYQRHKKLKIIWIFKLVQHVRHVRNISNWYFNWY